MPRKKEDRAAAAPEEQQAAKPAQQRRRKADPDAGKKQGGQRASAARAGRTTRGRKAAADLNDQVTGQQEANETPTAPETEGERNIPAGAEKVTKRRTTRQTARKTQATTETQAEAAPTRRTTRRTKKTTEAAQGAAPDTTTVAPDRPADEIAEANAGAQEAPKPKRPRRPRGTVAEPQTADADLPEVTATAAAPQETTRPETAAQAAELSAEVGVAVRPKPKRGRRKTAEPEQPEPQPAAPEPVAEAAVTEAEAETTAPAPRQRGRRTKKVAPAEEVTAQPAVQPEAQAAEAQTEVQAEPARKGRTGRKKTTAPSEPETAAQPTAPSEPEFAPVHVTAAPQAQVTPEEEEEDLEEEAAQPTTAAGINEVLVQSLRRLGRPVHVRDLERQLTRQDRRALGERRDIESVLERLVERGEVVRTRKRTYGLPEAMNLVRGRFQGSTSGFGFVIPETGGEDFFIAPDATMEAWNGDTVLVRPEGQARRGESPRATVVRIVQRAHNRLVGTLEYSKGYAILKADDTRARHRILLTAEGTEDVPGGARVVAELFWPEHTGEDEVYGRITRVLGEYDDPETETQAVIVKFNLRDEFPDDVLTQAQSIPAQIPESALVGRLDLREYNIFTVDGRDAKDFDDAIHIQPTTGGNFVVGVHIADVSHYVTASSPLDDEAFKRATSVYLPGHVLPMLPEHLSNGVCSLVPHEDRLTLSAMIEVNADGEVLSVQLAPSVIRSQARLTYDEVQAYSEGVAALPEHARKVEGDLHLLLKLTSRMRQQRLREGSLDFKLREVKVDVDEDGNLQLIPIREETARGMIEDLMLLANKVVARELLAKNAPALYRVHEEPTLGRFQEVSAALARMGIVLGTEPTPQAYQAALKKVRGTPQETVVNTLLLRSLKQAKYGPENVGHFGLAFDEYLHFTSPIRRYPDLIVHRAVRAMLAGELASPEMNDLRRELPVMGEHTSERERSAAEAERDLTKYYQAKWAQAHLGESFEGYVSGVTSFGLFVALENGVEGLLHISNLDDDYYVFIEDALILKGRSSGQVYRMGDHVSITIAQVNPLGRQIDFSQQENSMSEDGSKPRARRRGDRDQQPRTGPRESRPNDRGPRPAEPQRAEGQRTETQRPDGQRGQGPRGERAARPEGRGRAPERERGPDRGGERQAGPRERTGGGRRRVITLDRPRNEHIRPVNVTVQRMYFGDWSVENMREEPEERRGGGRPQSQRPSREGPGRGGRGGPARQGQGGQNQGGQNQGGQGRGQGGQPRAAQAARTEQPQQSQPAQESSGESGNRRRRRRRRRGNGDKGGE